MLRDWTMRQEQPLSLPERSTADPSTPPTAGAVVPPFDLGSWRRANVAVFAGPIEFASILSRTTDALRHPAPSSLDEAAAMQVLRRRLHQADEARCAEWCAYWHDDVTLEQIASAIGDGRILPVVGRVACELPTIQLHVMDADV